MEIQIQSLTKSFPLKTPVRGKSAFPVLRGLNLELKRGRATALVGESGCGKTTLAKILMQMEQPDGGSVNVGSKSLAQMSHEERRKCFQMVFQDPHSSLNPRWSLRKILEEPLISQRMDSSLRSQKVTEILKSVGFDSSVLDRRVSSFSGGQKQRLVIARALLMDPQILICDEPVSALDVSIQGQILNLLASLKRERDLGILFISHDLSVVRAFADDAAILYLGRIVERGPAEEVLTKPKHPYTKLLMDSIPRLDSEWSPERVADAGETPSPLDLTEACSFLGRCGQAQEACRLKAPEWTQAASSGFECYNPNKYT